MPDGLVDLLSHTWWSYQRNSGTWFDLIYPLFNVAEALAWFGVSVYVTVRASRHHRVRQDAFYALLWLMFGLTDLREAWVQQTGLILVKAVILAALVVTRRRVIKHYPGAKAV